MTNDRPLTEAEQLRQLRALAALADERDDLVEALAGRGIVTDFVAYFWGGPRDGQQMVLPGFQAVVEIPEPFDDVDLTRERDYRVGRYGFVAGGTGGGQYRWEGWA